MSTSTTARRQHLITELQNRGLRLNGPEQEHVSRRGGAGPSDHQAVTIDGVTLMVPIHTQSAWRSPFSVAAEETSTKLLENKIPVADITFADKPRFYDFSTADGIPYSHIATLHSKDVLATTVLQTCIRYESRRKACKFCSIGQSLRAGRTIAHKTPQQLAEVAKTAVELDGIKHMVMTTGTPATSDRGAAVLVESAEAIRAAVDIPIQAQCEPPKNPTWYKRLKEAGVDSLGMHLEVVTPALRDDLMPGKAEVSIDDYMVAFREAVAVFGRGQVSTYILAGLGDTSEAILETCDQLIEIGVYPFVVPFVPITGTPLEDLNPPSSDFMESILAPLGKRLRLAGIRSSDIKAGCGRCGACSTLSEYE
ncbi:MSMEG_0568 family radical SAM protein [Marinobacter sp.]|uniref:MSMEG_0568 family radical SAM protein n=1 Tax=Marinobacter sp. TaxID=50741 RepID=UPI003B51BCC0